MPIYAYRCAACGHSRDVLQKMSDAPLTVCPACNAEQFLTQSLKSALALVDVRVLDHLVVGQGQVVSFAERGLL